MGFSFQSPLSSHSDQSKHKKISKMVQITGSYTQTSAENYEELLKALNVGFMLRKAALASTPTMTITNDGGNWTMCTKTTMKSVELKFKLGEEFEEETTDGRKQDNSDHGGRQQVDHETESC